MIGRGATSSLLVDHHYGSGAHAGVFEKTTRKIAARGVRSIELIEAQGDSIRPSLLPAQQGDDLFWNRVQCMHLNERS